MRKILGWASKEAHGVFNGHFQNVGNGLAAVGHFKRLSVVPLALADFTGHLHIGKEVHLDGLHPLALASFAASALDIEGEASHLVSPQPGLGGFGKHFSDLIKDAGVGGGVAAAGAADGGLVHFDQTVDLGQAIDSVMGQRMFTSAKMSPHRAKQDLVHQGALARARDAGHAHQAAEREGGVDALQVVPPRVLDDEGGFLVQRPAIFRRGQAAPTGEVVPGEAVLVLGDLGGGALGDHGPPVHPGGGANIHQVIGGPNGVLVVFDHHDGVADVGQVPQGLQQPFIVSLMEANGRFVQHIAAAHQPRSHLGGQTNALGFAAGKRVGRTIQSEIPKAHGLHEAKSGFHFLQNGRGDSVAFLAQREVVEVRHRIHDGHRGNFGDVGAISAQTHAQRCGLQSLAATSFARCGTHVALQAFFHRIALGFVVAAFQAGDHARPDDVANLPAVHQNVPHFGGEL